MSDDWERDPKKVVWVLVISVIIIIGFLLMDKATYDTELAKAKACHGYVLYRGRFSTAYTVCQEKP